jgi:hypothetical protein
MSTRCLKPNTLILLEFLKTFVAFFAVCSRCIVAVRCRERLSFSEATAAISDGTFQPRAQKVLVSQSVPFEKGPKIQVAYFEMRVAKETAPAWGDAGAIGGCAIGGRPRHHSDVGSQSAAAINFRVRVA